MTHPTQAPAHDCVQRLNEHLAEFNTQIAPVFALGASSLSEYLQIATTKIDCGKRGKPRSMFASYCPFCGISLATPN
jgi:hypothetical protein